MRVSPVTNKPWNEQIMDYKKLLSAFVGVLLELSGMVPGNVQQLSETALMLIILDMVLGSIASARNGQFSSSQMRKGLALKLTSYFGIVVFCGQHCTHSAVNTNNDPDQSADRGGKAVKHLIRITIILLMTFPVFGCGAFGISFGGVKTQPTTTTLEPNYYGMIAHAKWNHNPITYAVYGGDSSIPFINIRATVERGFNRWEKYMAPLGYSFVQVNPNRLPAPDVKVMIETAWDIAKETGSDPRNTDGDT
ncbi:MAG: hypothetical protein EBR82_51700, partial [Caulobacteraceae bacterium]|nr:hypothetical protein [Caulobacteraceae bacterium]